MTYKLNSIGKVQIEGATLTITVSATYLKGLRHLSHFSHIMVLFEQKTESNILSLPISQYVGKIQEIDEKSGIMIVNLPYPALKCEQVTLYDIKPYFPNEDRIQNSTIFEKSEVHHQLPHLDTFEPLGTIQIREGRYLLKIKTEVERVKEYITQGSHLKVIWWFNRFDKPKYRKSLSSKPPYENSPEMGIFASRSPVRPNPIAVTTVKILSYSEGTNEIMVSQMDCFDATPLLGISLYNPAVDNVSHVMLPPWLSHWTNDVNDNEIKLDRLPVLKENHIYNYLDQQKPQEAAVEIIRKKNGEVGKINEISIKGANQNNLKNIDVKIPYGLITVITGISGSGKSSLAFDTILAESQRSFYGSMSLADRSNFSDLEKPKVDSITGLPPAIFLSQNNSSTNPRSTVATMTGIHELLRILYASIGIRHCPSCGEEVQKLTVEQIVTMIQACIETTRLKISPYGSLVTYKVFIVPSQSEQSFSSFCRDIKKYVVYCLEKGNGAILIEMNQKETSILQTTEKCYACDYLFFELAPANFSFNNIESACLRCKGTGIVATLHEKLIITDQDKSILDVASPYWGNLRKFREAPNNNWMKGEIIGLANSMGIDLETPWNCLPDEFREKALHGTGQEKVTFEYTDTSGSKKVTRKAVEGVYPTLKRLIQTSTNRQILEEKYTKAETCTSCNGEQLEMENRIVTVGGTRFPEVVNMSIDELKDWLTKVNQLLEPSSRYLVQDILEELFDKATAISEFGLGYLTLNRITPSLSGGEFQRVQLVNQLTSTISNVLYILDEPTTGLHPRDFAVLMNYLNKLKELNNTIIVVEHDLFFINQADYVIDIGGGAGSAGGHLIASGAPKEIKANPLSETGNYLSGRSQLSTCQKLKITEEVDWIKIGGIKGNNLKKIDIKFPRYSLTCITGVSGSGKSSLVKHGIFPAISNEINEKQSDTSTSTYTFLKTTEGKRFSKILHVTQKPIGRSSRSTPATYTGISDEIRKIIGESQQAKEAGMVASAFSFNNKTSQCSLCKGYGYQSLAATYFKHVKTSCPMCKGSKFNQDILNIQYKKKNIAEIYQMSVLEALAFFDKHVKIKAILAMLNNIGLGYLILGQSSQTLSGGEAQRIKLATEMCKNSKTEALYLLDEPTTGLHYADIQNLLFTIEQLKSAGNTIVLIEHNSDVIKNSDWIIDLGKEGGVHGGNVVVQGTPKEVKQCKGSYTGELL